MEQGNPTVRLDQEANLASFTDQISRSTFLRFTNAGRMHLGLLITVMILLGFGLIMLLSESTCLSYYDTYLNDPSKADPMHYFAVQSRYVVMAFFMAIFIGRFTTVSFYNRLYFMELAYAACTVLLVLVPILGRNLNNAKRWISIFGITFQPSEIAKFLVVYCLAVYYSHLQSDVKSGRFHARMEGKSPKTIRNAEVNLYIFYPVMAIGVWVVLILLQPHLSGAAIVVFLTMVMMFTVKIPRRIWLAAIPKLLMLIPIALLAFSIYTIAIRQESPITFVAKRFAHVEERLDTFAGKEDVTDDESYQVRQSLIALGAGGKYGLGLTEGRQKFNYLPMIYNDYLFSAIGEELGFVGTSGVLLCFLLFFFFGLQVAKNCDNLFSLLISWGYTFLISLQALLHIAVATNTIPATGISLPFFSYGGSSNTLFIVSVGLILCVSRTGQQDYHNFATFMHEGRQEIHALSKARKTKEKIAKKRGAYRDPAYSRAGRFAGSTAGAGATASSLTSSSAASTLPHGVRSKRQDPAASPRPSDRRSQAQRYSPSSPARSYPSQVAHKNPKVNP